MKKKIVIKESKEDKISLNCNKMCPRDAVHFLATALVHIVKKYDMTDGKEDLLRIIGLYYDDAE